MYLILNMRQLCKPSDRPEGDSGLRRFRTSQDTLITFGKPTTTVFNIMIPGQPQAYPFLKQASQDPCWIHREKQEEVVMNEQCRRRLASRYNRILLKRVSMQVWSQPVLIGGLPWLHTVWPYSPWLSQSWAWWWSLFPYPKVNLLLQCVTLLHVLWYLRGGKSWVFLFFDFSLTFVSYRMKLWKAIGQQKYKKMENGV